MSLWYSDNSIWCSAGTNYASSSLLMFYIYESAASLILISQNKLFLYYDFNLKVSEKNLGQVNILKNIVH